MSFGTGTGVVYATALSFTGVKDTVHAMKVAGVTGTASDIAENVKVQFGAASKDFMLDQAVTGKGTAEFLGTTTVKSTVNDANANLVFADKVTFEGGNITQAKTADFKKGFELKADATVNNISALVGGLDVSTHTLTTDASSVAKIVADSKANPLKVALGGKMDVKSLVAGDDLAAMYVVAPKGLATETTADFVLNLSADISADKLAVINGLLVQPDRFSGTVLVAENKKLLFKAQASGNLTTKVADANNKLLTVSGDGATMTTSDGEISLDKEQKDAILGSGLNDSIARIMKATDQTSSIAKVVAEYVDTTDKAQISTFMAKVVERALPAADVASVSGVSDITSAIGASVSTSGAVSLASNNIDTRLASLGLASGSEGSSGVGFWAQGMMSTGTQDKDGAQEAFGITTKAITGGFDFSPADGHAMGVAFTYANADLDLTDGTKEKTSFVPKVFNMYTSNSLGSDVFFRGRFDLAYTDATNTGKGVFSAKDKELKSTYQTRYLGASGLVGVNVAVAENTFIAPMGGMNYKHIEGYVYKQQFNETASLKKEFASKGAASVTGGFSLYYVSSGEGYSIVPEATVMGVYDLDTQGQKMTVNDSDLVYTVEGEKAASALSVNGSVGATVKYDTIEVGVKAHGAWRSKYLGYGGSLKLRVNL